MLMLKDSKQNMLSTFEKKIFRTEIVNKYWKLIKLDGKNVEMKDNQEKEQYFILKDDGTFLGLAGCNQFNGLYKLENEFQISFEDNIAVTMKICPDVDIDESVFLEVFKLANNYTISEDKLFLNVGRRTPLAEFEAIYF